MPDRLPQRQQAVYDAIVAHWNEHGIAPSSGELAAQIGISRTTIHEHLHTLQRKGRLERIAGKSRSWRPTQGQPVRVPVVGRVVAGAPIFAQENIDDWLIFDDARAGETLFALRVRGESMIGAGILDGDLVIVRQQSTANHGDIVVALVNDEDATVKKLQRDGDAARLIAMNPAHQPLVLEAHRVRILGRVVGVHRSLRTQEPRG